MQLLLALFLFCSLGYAEVVYPGLGSIAHIADGGGIQVEFVLTNLDDTASTYILRCYDNNGNPLSLMTNAGTGSEFTETLAGRASRRIRTAGTAAKWTEGWASIQTTGGTVGASAIIRFSTGPWTGSEAEVPADTWLNNRFSLAFDHTSSVIGLAMVNPSYNDPIAVTVTFRGEDGSVIVTETFNMGRLAHRAFVTTSSYPATVGKRGTIDISTTGSNMSVLALRFGPSAISSVPPLVSSQWAVPDDACMGCWDY
jgi:hypothetical protein